MGTTESEYVQTDPQPEQVAAATNTTQPREKKEQKELSRNMKVSFCDVFHVQSLILVILH